MASLPSALRYRPYNEDDGLGDGTYELVMAAYRFRSTTMQPLPLHETRNISFFDMSNAYTVTPVWMLYKLSQLVLKTMCDPIFHDSDSVCYASSLEKYQMKLEPLNDRFMVKSVIIARGMFPANVIMVVLRLEARTNANYQSREGAIIVARVNDIPFGQMRVKTGSAIPTSLAIETLHQNLVKCGGICFWDDGTRSGYCEDLYLRGTEKRTKAYVMLRDLNGLLNKHRKVVLLKYPAVEERELMEQGTYPPPNAKLENGEVVEDCDEPEEGEQSPVWNRRLHTDYNVR